MSVDQNRPNGDSNAYSLEEIIQRELAASDAQHNSSFQASDRAFFGLALSGGGIRSATFNLGILQGLERLKLLSCFDYLSTVSGGGYIGSFWTLWRHQQDNASSEIFPATEFATQGMPSAQSADRNQVEPPEIQHLRQFSNFLTPRLGLLSTDTGRLVIAVLSSMIPALLASLSLIILVLFVWLWLARLVYAAMPFTSLLAQGGMTLIVLILFEWWWQRQEQARGVGDVTAGVLAIVVSALVWSMAIYPQITEANLYPEAQVLPVINENNWFYLFVLCLPWAICVLVNTAVWFILSRFTSLKKIGVFRAALNRVAGRLLFLMAAWAAIAGLWIVGEWLWQMLSVATASGFAALTGIFGGLFTWAQKILSSQLNKPAPNESRFTSFRLWMRQVLAYLTLACMIIGLILIVLSIRIQFTIGGVTIPAILAGAICITLVTLVCFDPNQVSLHAFYRSRVARAYLGAARHPAVRSTEEQEDDDIQLSDLKSGKPFHLICCAANDLAPLDKLATLYRGAESAVLSPGGFSVGGAWMPWSQERSAPSLGSAITASAAALNSHMGFYSMELGPAVIFLMTTLNLRLGMWLPNPKSQRRRRRWKALVGLPFYKELLGYSRTSGADVLLSDGGHFENLGLYELIRRRCRYIVVSDCGKDQSAAFNDFGNVVRRIREDFGVEIVINVAPLRPNQAGFAGQHMVAGDIYYPGGDTGVLLLFKPCLTGDEPTDVAQYKQCNPAFPHESTGDQFYNEAQWESYRRLGEHAIEAAFQFVDVSVREPAADSSFARIFAQARREWCPTPENYGNHISHLN